MKGEIIQRLNVILNALNNISVCGKANLANLSGSISMIEDIRLTLNSAEVTMPEAESNEE